MDNHHLSKKEKYLLKKQKKEQECLARERRKKVRKIIVLLLSVILVVGGIAFGLMNYSPAENQEGNQGRPKVEISPQEYDAGTVSMAEGQVQYTYEIKNTGSGDLKIDRIWTSCMCTTASLRVGDEESDEFGMHSNPILWSQKVAPGETGFLEVTFDPAFHGPEGTGPVVRAVYISTNDPQNKKLEVRLMANVVQ